MPIMAQRREVVPEGQSSVGHRGPPPAARRPRLPNTHSMSTKLSWHPIRRLATALPRGSRPTAGRSVPIAAESGRPGGSAATRAPVCSGAACASDTTLTPCVLGRTRARRRQPFGPLPVRQLPCYHSVALSGHSVGAWRSLAARIVRDDEVGGSNPLAPTIPITNCVGNNPAFISAWPISQAFSFG